MTFRVGQKVVCVDISDLPGRAWVFNDAPTEGAVYTVAGFCEDIGYPCIILREHKRHPDSAHRGFAAFRFRPVVERKTDISIFTKMLTGKRVDA